MKNKVYVVLAALLIMLSMSRCKEDEPYNSLSVLSAPKATLNITDVKDSSFVLSLSSDMKGYAAFVIYDDTSAVAPTQQNLIEQNLDAAFTGLSAIEKDGTLSWTIGPLDPNKSYEIFAATSNADGVISDIVTEIIKTTDNVSPSLVGYTPSSGHDGVAVSSTFTLTYDEAIAFDDTKSVSLTYYSTGVVSAIPADAISVSGRNLIISQVETPVPGELIMLNMEEGAVKDLVGNPADSIYTAVVDGAIEGNAYWYIEVETINMIAVTPESGASIGDQNFAITLKFDSDMDLASGGPLPVMTYYDGLGVYTFEIPANYIDANPADSTVTLYKPELPDIGNWVSLSLPEGVFVDSKNNPNAAIESKADGAGQSGLYWLVSYGYTRDLIIGSYSAYSTSYYGSANDETDAITIEADPDDPNGVIMTGLRGSTEPVYATFDGDFGTLTFPPYSHVYMDDNGTPDDTTDDLHVYFESNSGDPMVATVYANGDFELSLIWFYSRYDQDFNYVDLDNAFVDTYFTKQPAAASVSIKSASIPKVYGTPKSHAKILDDKK